MASCPFLFVFVVTNGCTTSRFFSSSYSVDEIAMNVLMRRSDWHWHVSDNPDSFHHLSNLMSANDADPDPLNDWEWNSNRTRKRVMIGDDDFLIEFVTCCEDEWHGCRGLEHFESQIIDVGADAWGSFSLFGRFSTWVSTVFFIFLFNDERTRNLFGCIANELTLTSFLRKKTSLKESKWKQNGNVLRHLCRSIESNCEPCPPTFQMQ